MTSNFPVEIVSSILKVAENGDGDVELGELFPGDGGEPGVPHGGGDGILPEARVKLHLIERTDAATELLVFPNLPSHEQRVVVVDEAGNLRRLEVVQMAVQNIETVKAHFGFDYTVTILMRDPHAI